MTLQADPSRRLQHAAVDPAARPAEGTPPVWDGARRHALLDANDRSLLPALAPLLIWAAAWGTIGPAGWRGPAFALVSAALTLTAALRVATHGYIARRPRLVRVDARLLIRAALLTAALELGGLLTLATRWDALDPATAVMLAGAALAAAVAAVGVVMDDVVRIGFPVLAFVPATAVLALEDLPAATGRLVVLALAGPLLLAVSRRLRDDYWETASLGAMQRTRTRELEQLSSTDALTGVGNRLGFDRRLSAEWHRATHHGGFVSVLMIDLDHFKLVNDTYGHPVGDRCLQTVARLIGEEIEDEEAFTARYGGEEFVVLLPGTGPPAAAAAAERVRGAVRSTSVAGLAGAGLSCSIGVATVAPARAAHGADALIAHADAALYRAKGAGRNRVHVADAVV